MTDLRKAVEIALDYIRREGWTNQQGKEVWLALRQALAKAEWSALVDDKPRIAKEAITPEVIPEVIPEVTPEATEEVTREVLAKPEQSKTYNAEDITAVVEAIVTAFKLRREWIGLTDEERADCWSSSAVQSAINIEAKLKEKNA